MFEKGDIVVILDCATVRESFGEEFVDTMWEVRSYDRHAGQRYRVQTTAFHGLMLGEVRLATPEEELLFYTHGSYALKEEE